MSFGIKLHLSGEFACFTRPEMKGEIVATAGILIEDARQQRVAPFTGGDD